eukprot:scaffold40013_cov59-Attheya_sp.AAC.3
MTSMSKPLLIIDAAVIHSKILCNPWPLLKHLSAHRSKTAFYESFQQCFSAHDNEKIMTVNIEVDFYTFTHGFVWDIPTASHIMWDMRGKNDRLVYADCYVFVHDWSSSALKILALQFDESPLKEMMKIAQFDFGSKISLKDSLLPFLICQVFFKTEDMRGFGEVKAYKALVPPKSRDFKLKSILLPIYETVELRPKEMMKK